jgi:hypothetical protein
MYGLFGIGNRSALVAAEVIRRFFQLLECLTHFMNGFDQSRVSRFF